MRVLVPGGGGWLGRSTCTLLAERGHDVVVFDRTNGYDACRPEQVDEAISQVDHVVNLSGILGTHELLARPQLAVDVHVSGALNIVRACHRYGVGLTYMTMPEVNPSVYRATKACAVQLAEAYRHADPPPLRVSYVRGFNLYGPGQAHGGDHPQKIVPTFARAGWAGEPLPIWGDGMLWVDLVHVDDVARMLVEAMAFGEGEVFDAGTGYVQTVLEVARKVVQLTGGRSKVDHLPARKGERTVSTDADVARGEGWDLLDGWRPIFDPERFADAVRSYR